MGIKFYDSNGKYWGEYDETRSLFIPSEEPTTQTETQNSNLTFEKRNNEQTEPSVVMPKKCKGCDSASKIIEAYSRGYTDGADAVKKIAEQTCEKCEHWNDTEDGCADRHGCTTDCPWK